MPTTRDEILQLLMSMLKFLRMDPGGRSGYTYVLFFVMTICRCLQMYYSCLLIRNNPDSFVIMAKGAKTFAANIQGLKQIALFQENDLLYLTAKMKEFWYSKEVDVLEKRCKRFTQTFSNLVYVAFFAIVLMPVVFLRTLPYDGDYPEFPGSFWIFAVIQCVQFAYDSIIILAVDCLFLCLSICVYAQLRLLNCTFARLGDDGNIMQSKLVVCVDYHNFLLEFIQKYATMFSSALLIQYCITCVSVCIEIFVFTKQAPIDMVASVFYLMTLLFQLSMYCLPAEIVIEEAFETGNAIHTFAWYKYPKLSRIFIQHIMRRAQREVVFAAGGLAKINRAAFTNIFQWTISLHTLMNEMEAKKSN